MLDKDEFWAELDGLGEKKVQENLDLMLYSGRKLIFARAWINQQAIKEPWHQTTAGKFALTVLAAFVAGVCVAFAAFRLGWMG